ncbi:MAG TPA: MBOAT family O-acyltransferase, partial [Acidimicrobiales bacterium]|nr:MBOAT family O-acyltransferase [Acidimicrobiales bacterium]
VISSFLSKHIVDPVFAVPHQHSALEVLFAIYGYAVQIYADFSGYTDIAIGVALLLGFRFPENFNAPYTAESLQDFWRRWHITLSLWLRDYVYIPLGGNRGSRWKTARNIFLTMLIGGLWHGAAWTFVAWGALHGGGQVVGMLRRDRAARRQPESPEPLEGSGRVAVLAPASVEAPARVWVRRLVTFHLVCLGWVLFRATSFGNAVTLLSRLAHPGAAPLVTPLVVGVIVVSIASQYVPRDIVSRAQQRFAELAPVAQGGAIAAGLYTITTLGPQGVAPFIYYRF